MNEIISVCAISYLTMLVLVPVGAVFYNRRQSKQYRKVDFVMAMTYAFFWPVILPAAIMGLVADWYNQISNIE